MAAKAQIAALFAVVAGITLSGCGSSGTDAQSPTASSTPSVSRTSTPTASATTPTSTPSLSSTTALPPLSPYEDQPQVVGLRAFARQYGKAVNAGEKRYPPLMATMGPTGQKPATVNWMFGNDLTKKLEYPGPLPLTPTSIVGDKVFACVWFEGFATDRKTGAPSETRKIEPLQFWMLKGSDGKYVVNGIYNAAGLDCSKHKVTGRTW